MRTLTTSHWEPWTEIVIWYFSMCSSACCANLNTRTAQVRLCLHKSPHTHCTAHVCMHRSSVALREWCISQVELSPINKHISACLFLMCPTNGFDITPAPNRSNDTCFRLPVPCIGEKEINTVSRKDTWKFFQNMTERTNERLWSTTYAAASEQEPAAASVLLLLCKGETWYVLLFMSVISRKVY